MKNQRSARPVGERSVRRGRVHPVILVVTMTAAAAIGVFWAVAAHRTTHLYTGDGFGGYVGENRKPLPDTEIQKASDAYAQGRYADAERIAHGIVAASRPGDPAGAHAALLAMRIDAYSAARRHDYAEAKRRFEALRLAAYRSPDHGKQRVPLGEVAPTLEEEGAFQEAVCTNAMGDKGAAEQEYDAFLRDHPTSILVHAAVKRVGRLHGGDIPKETETLWKTAMQAQKAAEESQRRSEAICGPECLAEMLQRRPNSPTPFPTREAGVMTLAAEMKTSGDGTSMAAMVAAAARHGLRLQGVQLTEAGLKQQRLPLIALIQPAHYVIVEQISPFGVTVWDPDAHGVGKADRRTLPAAEWKTAWSGMALR